MTSWASAVRITTTLAFETLDAWYNSDTDNRRERPRTNADTLGLTRSPEATALPARPTRAAKECALMKTSGCSASETSRGRPPITWLMASRRPPVARVRPCVSTLARGSPNHCMPARSRSTRRLIRIAKCVRSLVHATALDLTPGTEIRRSPGLHDASIARAAAATALAFSIIHGQPGHR